MLLPALTSLKGEVRGPTGKLLETAFTDTDGVHIFLYKYTRPPATFTVALPAFGVSQSVVLQSNQLVILNFEITYQVVFI